MNWLRERLKEPSSYTAFAVFSSSTGLFMQSLMLEPSITARALLLLGVVFAVLGIALKEGKAK